MILKLRHRFPGLYIWLRNGKKHAVKIPDGCLLLQAGKQLEHLTGGHVQAGINCTAHNSIVLILLLEGYYEVVCTNDTLETIGKAKREGTSLWRV